jgi:hypothetical protein
MSPWGDIPDEVCVFKNLNHQYSSRFKFFNLLVIVGCHIGGLKLTIFKPLSHSVLKLEPKLLEFIERRWLLIGISPKENIYISGGLKNLI